MHCKGSGTGSTFKFQLSTSNFNNVLSTKIDALFAAGRNRSNKRLKQMLTDVFNQIV